MRQNRGLYLFLIVKIIMNIFKVDFSEDVGEILKEALEERSKTSTALQKLIQI